MVNEKDIALIDDYLDGRFSQEEKTLLEKRFETEPDLAELLKLVKFTRESIRMSGQREQVKGIYTEFLQEKSSNQIKDLLQKVRPIHWWLGIAASFALLFVIGLNWISNFQDQILSEKYYSYQLTTMRSNVAQEDELELYFKNKDWEMVLSSVNFQVSDRQSLFLAGLSAMELKEFETALKYFNRIEEINFESSESSFKDEVEYYKVISYISMSDYGLAIEKIRAINSDQDHKYHKVFSNFDIAKLKILGIL